MPTSLGAITLLAAGGLGLGVSYYLTSGQQQQQQQQTGKKVLEEKKYQHQQQQKNLIQSWVAPNSKLENIPRTAILVKSENRGPHKLLRFKLVEDSQIIPTVAPLSYITLTGLITTTTTTTTSTSNSSSNLLLDPRYVFGRQVQRKYVPLLDSKQSMDHFEILVKKYPVDSTNHNNNNTTNNKDYSSLDLTNHHQQQEEEGITSQFLHALKKGDEIQIVGPFCQISSPTMIKDMLINKKKKNIGFIAGGIGITPFLQLVEFTGQESECGYSLIWSNRTIEEAKSCKMELDKWCKQQPDKFKARITITRKWDDNRFFNSSISNSNSQGSLMDRGRITKDMLKKSLPPPGDDVIIFVCGPESFVKAISGGNKNHTNNSVDIDIPSVWSGDVGGLLKELGYDGSMVVRLS
jgi:NAD(P)H-flavin reductase